MLIPTHKITDFETKIAKLQKRATKLGVEGITYKMSDPYHYEWHETVEGDVTVNRACEVVEVTLAGSPPILSGWAFVATIENFEGEPLVRSVPNVEPHATWKTLDPEHCSHCGQRRRRSNTYIVRDASGVEKQVGSSCLADFLGHKLPAAYALYVEALARLEDEISSWGFGGGLWTYDLEQFLTVTATSIRKDGWMSRTQARDAIHPVTATADRVAGYLTETNKTNRMLDHYMASDADRNVGHAAFEWATKIGSEDQTNDYLHNVAVIARAGYVTMRTAGIAASIVSAYLRDTEQLKRREIERNKVDGSVHFGEIKQRIRNVNAEVISVRTFEGQYGVTTLYTFAINGNVAKWFASRSCKLEIGDVVQLTGTIKKHDEYEGRKETTLTRCVVNK